MKNLLTKPIGEIARFNTNTISVFHRYGIDFFSKGKLFLREACIDSGCDESVILAELEKVSPSTDENQDYNSWSISSLIEYIVENHHQYANNTIPRISALFDDVLVDSEFQNPDLRRVNELFRHLGNDMKQHMQKEELALFPLMKKLEALKTSGNDWLDANLISVQSLISVIEMEHDTSAIILKQIAGLRDKLSASDHMNENILALTSKLKEFESDLIIHIHVENNVLHPKAVELEQELTGVLN